MVFSGDHRNHHRNSCIAVTLLLQLSSNHLDGMPSAPLLLVLTRGDLGASFYLLQERQRGQGRANEGKQEIDDDQCVRTFSYRNVVDSRGSQR